MVKEVLDKPKQKISGHFESMLFIMMKKMKEHISVTLDSGKSFTGYVVQTESDYMVMLDHLEENKVTDFLIIAYSHIASIAYVVPVLDGKPKQPIGFKVTDHE